MNQVYKIIFNKSLGILQVVSELVKACGKQASSKSLCQSTSLTNASASNHLATPPPYQLKKMSLAIALSCTAFAVPVVVAQTVVLSDASPNPYITTVDITGSPGPYSYQGGDGIYGNFTGSFEIINSSNINITGGVGGVGVRGGYTGGNGVYMNSINNNTLINNGTITGGAGSAYAGIYSAYGGNGGAGVRMATQSGDNTLTNNSTITGGAGGSGTVGGSGGRGVIMYGYNAYSTLSNTTLTNNGTITGGAGGASSSGASGGQGGDGVMIATFTAGDGNITLINNGAITGGAGGVGGGSGGQGGAGVGMVAVGYGNSNSSTTLINNGAITGGAGGVGGVGVATVTTFGATSLINNGTITGGSSDITVSGGSGVQNIGTLTALTNTGTITGGSGMGVAPGIVNIGIITTLSNSQGAGNAAGALNLQYSLPTNYKIILGSTAGTYGKLVVSNASSWDGGTGGTGTTSFGIDSGLVKSTKYGAVISGVTASLLTSSSLTGSYTSGGKTYAYTLALESGSTDIWDLLFPAYIAGPSSEDTQQSIVATAASLQNTFALQNAVLANSFSYDCTEFGANGICISAGGRNTAVQAANGLNNTSALLIAAYRPHPNYRIGAYADQNLSVNNAGSTVNLGNNTPLIGLFGAWNERLDGTGTEVKVSAAYGQKNTTVNRQVVGSSEPGSGSSQLNSQGAQVTAKYGFAVSDKAIVSPYIGMRYSQNNMNGYTEGSSSTVTAPLTYSALNTNATTALAGVGASYKVVPTFTTFASAGVETDTNTANGSYSATSSSISGLTPVNFNANPVKTRPTATLGAYYDIAKNQRLGITGIYRQEAYQAVSTTTVMATYTVGL